MGHINYFIRSATDFIFRRKHPATFLVLAGVSLFTLLLAGMAFNLSLPLTNGTLRLSFNMDGGAGIASAVALALATLLILFGIVWLFKDWKAAQRRRVLVVELRGLRDGAGTALADAIPPTIEGQRVPILMDVRQGVADGLIVVPERAVEKLMTLRDVVGQHEAGRDRADITLVAGGIAPVPLSFLAGVLLDDEAPITFFDWDRDLKLWNELTGADDGERFAIEGLGGVADRTPEVIVTVSASYRVDEPRAVARAGNMQIDRLGLPTRVTGKHWSEDKQRDLARQFLDTMTDLKGRGVDRVHLFFAGANSLVLRFGSVYDKRNLPALTVYQYESTAFTWGVEMPVAGAARPSIAHPGGS